MGYLMRCTVFVGMLVASPAFGQSLINDARIETLARLAVHEQRCELDVDDDAVGSYVASTFNDPAEALSALSSNINLYGSLEANIQGLDLTIRCAALRKFAQDEGLVSD